MKTIMIPLMAAGLIALPETAHAQQAHIGIRVPYSSQDALSPAYGTSSTRTARITPDGSSYLSYFTKARAFAVPYLGEGTYTFRLEWTVVADVAVTTNLQTLAFASIPITTAMSDLSAPGATVTGYSPGNVAAYPKYPVETLASAIGYVTATAWGQPPTAASWKRPTGTNWPGTAGMVTPGYSMGFPPTQAFSVTGTTPVNVGVTGPVYVYPPASGNFSSAALGTMSNWNGPTHRLDFEVVMDSANVNPAWKYFVCQDYMSDNYQNHLKFYSVTAFNIVSFKSNKSLAGTVTSSTKMMEGYRGNIPIQFSVTK